MERTAKVDVWLGCLGDGAESSPGQWALLDDLERARARRFRFARDRDRYVIAHAWLRTLLAEYAGVPAQQLCIAQDRFAKPRLQSRGEKQPRLFFNLSHTDAAVAVAVSRHCEVGVDVERIRPWSDVESFFETVLHEQEIGALGRLPAGDRSRYFFGVWCAKEAYTKATGLGLSHDFRRVGTGLEADRCAWRDVRRLDMPAFPSACLQVADRVETAAGMPGQHALAVAALSAHLDARLHVVSLRGLPM